MPIPALPNLPPDLQTAFPADELLAGLLEGSLVGVALYRPIRGPMGRLLTLPLSC
ncbi:hypothetical protein MUN81_14410 [Hymenobacter sp. 5317J-9]|uniref:hypothetical protein n=1 Tax=Hymenobacter sp. 5317J-9 TaxID=2932250 RepID=UPI001FD6FBD8|nr:hypothetical protein [Hymenobacter sp. 5317J-9]UOQ96435.1 hypothetical protein MUN81_14410 [Hymenobacter sp. 5317J-9]